MLEIEKWPRIHRFNQSNTDLTCYGFIFVATDLIHVCLAGEFPVKVRYVKRSLERLEHDRDRWHERLRLH